MTAKLGNADVGLLAKASTAGILKHLARIEAHVAQGRWLGVRNVYRLEPITRIKAGVSDPRRDRPLQLADYVAASSPLHLWDAWNYLGLAFYSHIRGSTDAAKHLAYYAELRAAMSLLATQGIGIFNNRHFVVDSSGGISPLSPRGTHEATWLYLENWAQCTNASRLLGRILRIQSHAITDWLAHLLGAGAWRPVGIDLLLEMGLDIKRMADDRTARNEASYRPTGFATKYVNNPHADANFVVESIRLLEPGGGLRTFEVLDMFIFRRIVERAVATGAHRFSLRDAVAPMVNEYVDHYARRAEMKRFLTRQSQPRDPDPVMEALRKEDYRHQDYHLQVMGRALLLLRVSTGAVRNVIRTSNLDLDSLSFWWQEAGSRQGFWNTVSPPTLDNSGLWQEVEEALNDIEDWISGTDASRESLLSKCGGPLTQATGMTRFALMGLTS